MYSEDWKLELNLDKFWSLIELARVNRAAFVRELETIDRRGLIRFAWNFEELASALGEKQYQKYTNPTFSEDVLDGLWEEVVGRGRDFYENVMSYPEKMPADINPSDPSHWIMYEVKIAFYERFGKEIPPYGYDY